jgi:hypothetical protein
MVLSPALPGQPYPMVNDSRCLTVPWYSAFLRLSNSVKANNGIGTLGAITGGALYTNGIYSNVALTGGVGNGATANITVAGGSVVAVILLNPGHRYQVGNVLSATAASIGGTGAGFSVPIATLAKFNIDLPPQSYPFVEEDRTISDGWYNSMLGLGVAAASIGGRKAAVPGNPYPVVDENRRITEPWYNALVVIANDLI